MYVNNLTCVRVKGSEMGRTRLYYVSLAFHCVYGHSDYAGKNGMGMMELRYMVKVRE